MILNELTVGQKFVLLRTGEKYVKGDYRYWRGKPTKRFHVFKVDQLEQKIKDGDLSLQCKIKPVLLCAVNAD